LKIVSFDTRGLLWNLLLLKGLPSPATSGGLGGVMGEEIESSLAFSLDCRHRRYTIVTPMQKYKNNYAFIDSQNLNLSIQE